MKCEKVLFDGLQGYEMRTEAWRLVVVTECGPRIAFLGKNEGENLLYWQKEGATRGQWRLLGGHRVWLTRPMADESEDTYLPDNDFCDVVHLENGLIATAPAHPVHKLERGMKIECLSEKAFRVTNFVRNAGDLIYSCGVWSPTCIRPEGKELRIPLGEDDVTWDLIKIVIPRVFAGNTLLLDDPQVTFENRDLVVRPSGQVTKRCVSAPKGEIRMIWAEKGIAFTKRSVYQRDARYPLDGCNLAVFVGQDNWMAEMESFGKEQPIIPGQTIDNVETWELEG